MAERRRPASREPLPGAPVSSLLPERPSLAAVRDRASGCKACDLSTHGAQTVFGEGPRRAALMLVGEQPGDPACREEMIRLVPDLRQVAGHFGKKP